MSKLYETISGLCEEHEITLYRLGAELGIRRSTFSDLKAGRKKTLTAETLQKIADYFKVPMGFLLTGEQKEKAPAKAEALSVDDRVDEILAGIDADTTLMLDGKPMSDEAMEAFRISLKQTVELARKLNREKKTKNAPD